jgi:hypothetical protein
MRRTESAPTSASNTNTTVEAPASANRCTCSFEREGYQGTIRCRDGKVWGVNWHVFLETSYFDAAWASVPRPGMRAYEDLVRDMLPHREKEDADEFGAGRGG